MRGRFFLLLAGGALLLLSAETPKTILDLQQFRQTNASPVRSGQGREGTATLVNLNPAINVWYLLQITWKDGAPQTAWHLENPHPHEAKLLLDQKYPAGLVIAEGQNRFRCDLFGGGSPGVLEQGRSSPFIYYPLCDGRLYLRNPAKGSRTALEATTEFLRDHVWGGEKVIGVFHNLLGERYRETAELRDQTPGTAHSAEATLDERPLPALIDPQYAARRVASPSLGIALASADAEKNGLIPGEWYAAAGNPGVFVSLMELAFVAPAILQGYRNLANNPDKIEASSLCYLVAFDLDQLAVGYALGTEHPRVDWSDRVTGLMRNAALPGPDGIGDIEPLISTGLIRPDDGRKTVAAFTAGFKRNHGAFKSGALALRNSGSHYGFIQDGVVFSTLQPGLATVFVLDDNSVGMKTWIEADNILLNKIKYARQNGVSLVEFDERAGVTIPGPLVARWSQGNWSGSVDENLRTLRAGAAMQSNHGKHFLIYAVFSDGTPSAMARVFQAYRTSYAMLLDMNALEHTYLAVYRRAGAEMSVDHLLKGMSVLDKSGSGDAVPRFLGYPDNRDFFYMMRREAKVGKP